MRKETIKIPIDGYYLNVIVIGIDNLTDKTIAYIIFEERDSKDYLYEASVFPITDKGFDSRIVPNKEKVEIEDYLGYSNKTLSDPDWLRYFATEIDNSEITKTILEFIDGKFGIQLNIPEIIEKIQSFYDYDDEYDDDPF